VAEESFNVVSKTKGCVKRCAWCACAASVGGSREVMAMAESAPSCCAEYNGE